MAGELIPLAKSLVSAGFSCIPIQMPSKTPYWSVLPQEWSESEQKMKAVWKPFTQRPPTEFECEKFWANGAGIALVAGYNHVELLDFDIPEKHDPGFTAPGVAPAWKPFLAIMREHGHEGLLKRLGCQDTPSGGHGIIYRCPEIEIPNNMRLACRADKKTLIETRGSNGYFGISPTPGYKLRGLKLTDIPEVTAEERGWMLTAAGLLDERTLETTQKRVDYGMRPDCKLPSQWFTENGPHLVDILTKHGWVESGRAGKRIALVRPGKGKFAGLSGTVTEDGQSFWCFSTSTQFDADYAYSKFSVYTILEHHNDFFSAVAAVKEMMPGRPGSVKEQTRIQKVDEAVTLETRRKTRWSKASEIECEKVKWLLEPYIPLGEVTLLVGDPGVGKSTLSQAIATAVTLGGMVAGKPIVKGPVIFMSAEQSRSTITVPRFKQMGADLDLITLPDEDDPTGEIEAYVLDFAGITVLREMAEETGAKLIVIDTMTAYVEAARDINTANQVREWMRRLISVARGQECAILLLMHPNKSSATNPLYKIMGSIDFSGAVRSVLYAGADPDDEDVRSAVHIKSNVGPKGDPLGFSIDPADGFRWLLESRLTAARILEAPQSSGQRGKRQACEEMLSSMLAHEMVPSKKVFEACKAEGFGRDIVYALKSKLGVRIVRPGYQEEVLWTLMPPEVSERWDQK